MAEKCKKCDPHEICEECPEWIFTMADLIMCMMGLFVLLWVLKPSPTPPNGAKTPGDPKNQQQKLIEQVAEIRAAFGYIPNPNSADPVDQMMIQKAMRLTGEREQGRQEDPAKATEGPDPMVTSVRPSKETIVGTKIDFGQGDAALTDDAVRTLNSIADQIQGVRYIIIIKGHASRDDFANASPQQMMDISIRRAQAVEEYLVKKGVSPDVLRVQGCSIYEPLKQQAYTFEAKGQNRRVEVLTTNLLVRDLQDNADSTAKPID